ncbi:hypothetical protein ACS6BV_002352 [Vibrio alginolyticus]
MKEEYAGYWILTGIPLLKGELLGLMPLVLLRVASFVFRHLVQRRWDMMWDLLS